MASDSASSKELESSFQAPGMDAGGQVCDAAHKQASVTLGDHAGLACKAFGWTSSWATERSSAKHGGRATLAYLAAHPEEADNIHVIIN